jgi:hypothetical protein
VRTPWVQPPALLGGRRCALPAVLRCGSLAGGSVFRKPCRCCRLPLGAFSHRAAGAGSAKGGALLPPIPPRDIGQRAKRGFFFGCGAIGWVG